MDIIKMARNLGKEIQNTTEYLNLVKAKRNNDNDSELVDLIGKFNLVKLKIQHLSNDMDEKNKAEIEKENEELAKLYEKIMQNENMVAFNKASKEINDMMNKINRILTATVNGEDPMTCSENLQIECGGQCNSCSGCK
ncbi:MAG: YlbF family regulator [Oscillospiraceae bacterium]|nr:YlbF family regulator [Oscillospiraceae bacterium]